MKASIANRTPVHSLDDAWGRTSGARGLFYVLLASLCLSTGPTVIKFGLNADAGPIPLMTFRFYLATFILWGVVAFFQPDKLRIDRRGIIGCAAAAAANTVSLLCFYLALTHIAVSVAIVIFSFYPLVVLLLLSLRGESITRINFARLGFALVGVYLLVGPGGDVSPTGIILVIGTAISFSVHLVIIQWRLSAYPAQTITVYIISFMTLMTGILYSFQYPEWPTFSSVGWGVIIWTGLVSTAIARFAMFAGIRHIGSGQTALLGPIEILLTVLWAMLFLGERLSVVQWLGGALILTSAALALRRKQQRANSPGACRNYWSRC